MTNVKTETPPAPRRSMGRKVPNLVLVYDSGVGSEFRIQCEVPLADEAEADALKKAVIEGTPAALKRAKDTVLQRIDPGATAAFKAIVAQAFDDNITVSAARERR